MLDSLIAVVSSLPAWGIVLAAFVITYVENILPPSPSDVLLVFIGTLVGVGAASFPVTLVFATLGSVAGFYTMFTIGRVLGDKIMQSPIGQLFPLESLQRAEQWFQRWGYYVIVVNRFLSGTRSVVSLFAGMSHLEPVRTTVLCGISALIWNTLVLYAGVLLGENWRTVEEYFHTYGLIIAIVIAVLLVWLIISSFIRRRFTE